MSPRIESDRERVERIYIDNSVFGACFEARWPEPSNRLLDSLAPGRRVALVSDVTIRELANAPPHVRDRALALRAADFISTDDEIERLADRFIPAGVVTRNHRTDALHVATATCRRADALVSWNFDHLVFDEDEEVRRRGVCGGLPAQPDRHAIGGDREMTEPREGEGMVACLRRIRDEMDERFKDRPLHELVEHIKEEAAKSGFLEHWEKTGALVTPPAKARPGR